MISKFSDLQCPLIDTSIDDSNVDKECQSLDDHIHRNSNQQLQFWMSVWNSFNRDIRDLTEERFGPFHIEQAVHTQDCYDGLELARLTLL